MYDAEQAGASSDASETVDGASASVDKPAGNGSDGPASFPPLVQESPEGPPTHRRKRRWDWHIAS